MLYLHPTMLTEIYFILAALVVFFLTRHANSFIQNIIDKNMI